MTDPLTPDERSMNDAFLVALFLKEVSNPSVTATEVLERLGGKPQPQPPAPLTLWAVYSADGCKLCTTDDETTAGLIANRRGARVVKMVEAV